MKQRRLIAGILGLTAMAFVASCDSSTSSNGGGSVTLDTNTYGVPWNSSITYGALTDSRDGQVYRTVKIGTQTWMAQNLNYKVDSSWCYANSADSCAKYGRLYQWSAAMGLASTYNTTLWSGTLPHQGACPSGWHVPSDVEWTKLTDTALSSSTSGTVLKSTSGWLTNTGTDAYGFRVLPAGDRGSAGTSGNVGSFAYFWSSSENDTSDAGRWYFPNGNAYVGPIGNDKTFGFSLRCLAN